MIDLLEANYLLSDTSGGAFSYSRETHMVAMNYMLPLIDKNVEGFINSLNSILTCADNWQAKIAEMNKQSIDKASTHLADLRAGVASTHDDHGHIHSMRSHLMPI